MASRGLLNRAALEHQLRPASLRDGGSPGSQPRLRHRSKVSSAVGEQLQPPAMKRGPWEDRTGCQSGAHPAPYVGPESGAYTQAPRH